MEEVSSNGEAKNENQPTGISAWGLRRGDRGYEALEVHENDPAQSSANANLAAPSLSNNLEIISVATEELYSGPLPSPRDLEQYERIAPGYAMRLIDSHLANEAVYRQAISRTVNAEAVSVKIGAIAAPIITVGSIASAVGLVVAGYPAGAIAIVPAIISAVAQYRAAKNDKQE